MKTTRRAARLLVVFAALQLMGCGEAPPVSTAVPDASRELLTGRWGVDFEASWALSRDAFLADTIRGASAYPDDPEEKARIVKDEMREALGDLAWTYAADGTASMTMGERTGEGTYDVRHLDGPRMTILSAVGRTQMIEITFVTRDEIHWRPPSKNAPDLVFRRQ